jgi:hypothetical protein
MDEVRNHLRKIVFSVDGVAGELPMAIQALDKVLTERGNELPGRLRHFLENRSYQKALVLVEGGEPEKGTCGK